LRSFDSSLILVGPGRAGSALARSWTDAGGTIAAVVGRSRSSADAAARRLGAAASFSAEEAASIAGDVVVIAVPDDRVAAAGRALAGRVSPRYAYHLSGALAARELEPLRNEGAAVGSLHPLAVFTGAPTESWKNTLVMIEGDGEAVRWGEGLAETFGARSHRLDASAKPLYHAAATLAAGGTAALLSVATRLWERIGLPETEARIALAQLSRGAAEAVAAMPFSSAFTGPVARRDRGTVQAHLQALGHTAAAGIYAALAEETLERTPQSGSESEIRRLLVLPVEKPTR
jgi:predicted short-subunit dehydrogenase-like oxidoreductase (DUF2520 family)